MTTAKTPQYLKSRIAVLIACPIALLFWWQGAHFAWLVNILVMAALLGIYWDKRLHNIYLLVIGLVLQPLASFALLMGWIPFGLALTVWALTAPVVVIADGLISMSRSGHSESEDKGQ